MNYVPFDTEDDVERSGKTVRFPTEHVGIAPVDVSEETRRSREQKIHELSLVLHQPDDEECSASFQRPTFGSNQRQFCRCPVIDEDSIATLTVNGRKHDCRIVQMSIGGFGVLMSGRPRLDSGAVGTLTGTNLNYVVAVSRIEANGDEVYVGLRQIEEVVDPRQLSGEPSPFVSYMIAGLAAAFVVAGSYCFISGR